MKRLIAVAVLSVLIFTGCATSRTHAPEGAAIGGATGVALGTIASRGDGLFAPLAFGLFGAAVGAAIGDQYSKVPPSYDYGEPASGTVQAEGSSDIIVNLPNSNGTTTRVLLKRSGGGFVGPQGEYYPNFPPMAQLQAMYGN